MADDLLKELLTSPLEKQPRRKRRRRNESESGISPEGEGEAGEREPVSHVPFLWVGAAAVLGALIVIAGYVVAAEEPVLTTTTTTTTSTPVVVDDGSPAGLPDDYTAVGGNLGMRVERVLMRSDGVFLTVTTVVENSLDPETTAGFQGGLWALILGDGTRITSTVESFDPLARGTVTVWFPPEGVIAEDITALELNGVATRTTNAFSATTTAAAALPDDGSTVSLDLTPARFEIDAGVTLVAESVVLTPTGARVAWALQGEALANASVVPIVLTVLEDGLGTTAVPGFAQSSGFNFFHPSVATPPLSSDGVMGFELPAGETLPTGLQIGAGIDFQITWATYQPMVASIPVAGAVIAVVE